MIPVQMEVLAENQKHPESTRGLVVRRDGPSDR